jgi:LPS O-antigen subunit length determinant protein (WzzB/FepE family)
METAVQNNDEIEIDLVDLIRQIWRNKGIIILSAWQTISYT